MSYNCESPCLPCEPCCWPFPAECPHPPPPPLTAFTSGTGTACGRVQAYLIPSTTAPNADIVLDTKGTGALYRSNTFPDTNACRGNYATDLQSNRTAPTQVASGNNAVIAGGNSNTASGTSSVAVGGLENASAGTGSSIGGGIRNQSNGTTSTVSGGNTNTANGDNSTVGGGNGNVTNNDYTTIGGGVGNRASGLVSLVGGGSGNTADGDYSSVAGGSGNVAGTNYSTVGGGLNNTATTTGTASTVAGGESNLADGDHSFVGGGSGNHADGSLSTVAGGSGNIAGTTTLGLAFIGGGGGNIASGASSVVGGGSINTASADSSTIAGGASNTADGASTFIGGGTLNMAHGSTSTIAGGANNVAGSTTATGFFSAIGGGSSNTTNGRASTIPGGFLNTTNGDYSSALGGFGLLLNNMYSSAVGTYNNDITPPVGPTPDGYRLFMVGNGTAAVPANVFSVDQAGNVRATGSFATVPAGGADFAEYLESNSGEHYPYGTSVTLLPNGKIKKTEQGETPVGVVSNSAGFICGGGDDYWQGKYERDEHGNIVLEDIPTGEDKDGEPILRKALKLSPHFDPGKAYIPRNQRPEWHTVGLLGFVEVLDGETVHPNWVRLHQKQAKQGKVWHLLR